MKRFLLILMITSLAFACGEKKDAAQQGVTPAPLTGSAQATAPAALPEGHPPITASAAPTAAAPAQTASAPAGKLTGTVAETMDSGGYTYIKVKTAAGEEWAAVQQTKVKKGQNVTVVAQMTAEKFASNTLKRTFDRIVFGTIEGTPAPAAPGAMMSSAMGQMPPNHPPMGGANPMGTAQQHMSAPAAGDVKVAKAEGADAKTVSELWASKGALADKPVVVRGKVVKFLAGIMGKNWLHLRDGSGAPGSDDITVTTNDVANVGDVVTVRGTLRADKDFGAGYKYAVIVEDAKVTK